MDTWTFTSKNFTIYKGIDPEVDKWAFMSSPWAVVTLTAAYIYGVKWGGPALMERRNPFELKKFIVLYNLFQILWAGYLISLPFWRPAIQDCILNYCQKSGEDYIVDDDFKFASWAFFVSKIVDLLDTVIFILRKKYKQISFLHVYHHSVIVVSAWYHLKYILDPSFIILIFLNEGVHFIMYQYYLLAAMGPKFTKFLWWKKHLTQIQLSQFVFVLGYIAVLWYKQCDNSRLLGIYIAANNVLLILLFGNFYMKTYIRKWKKTV